MINSRNLLSGDKIKGNKRGEKYKNYLRPIIEKLLPSITQGQGIKTITLPCNPNDLLERMDLLFESKRAGNTNVNIELNAIIDKLYKSKTIDKNTLTKLKKQL